MPRYYLVNKYYHNGFYIINSKAVLIGVKLVGNTIMHTIQEQLVTSQTYAEEATILWCWDAIQVYP